MLRTRDRDPPRTRAVRPCQRLAKVRRQPASGDPQQPSPHSTDSDRTDIRRIEMRDTFSGREDISDRCEPYGRVSTDDSISQNHCETCKLSSSLRLNNCQCCGELSGSDSGDNFAYSFSKVLSWRGGVCHFGSRSKRRSSAVSLVFNFLLLLAATAVVQGRGIEVPRYETAYACEGKTLKIECRDGEVIHLIRANYGRFSITICNDHGNTDWSVNCMSTKSLRVLHNRCSMNQNCSILASTTMFGDPCPNTLKYLEAHYQCITAATTSSTIRPSPPWLITSQPSVWRSTVPTSSLGSGASNGAGNSGNAAGREQGSGGGSETKNNGGGSGIPPSVHHLTPPTFRPHITMPPDLRPGVVKIKNDGHSPEVIGKPVAKIPPESVIPIVTEQTSNNDRTERPLAKPNDEEQSREAFTEDPLKKKDDKGPVGSGEQDRDTAIPPPPHERDHSVPGEGDGNRRHHHHNHHDNPDVIVPSQPHWRHCSPQLARGLQWNWTTVGDVALQPCPGGATGLARWRCVSSAHKQSHLQQQRRLGAPSRETGSSSQERAPLLLDGLGSDTLLTGRDIDTSPDLSDFRDDMDTLMLPDSLASSAGIDTENQLGIDQPNAFGGDGQPVWISENPDLSECRSVWLNSLETRVKEGESLLSISNDLSQVTSSKTLYGGDMMTTTGIMKRLAQRMALNIQSFPDTRQREAIVTDLLLGVVKTGSNLLDISQQASWKDLSHPVQMRVATSLLIGLEENAFLLAEAVLREKTIVHQMKNIVLSVRVLEARHVETEEFPSAITREQWTASQDTIHLPRGALIDNSEGGLVRIVFVAFDRLEEILQPLAAPPGPTLPDEVPPSIGEPQGNSRHQQMNSQRDRDNITRVINSKVISASLGKGRHIQLSQPVRLTLRHLRTDNVTNPTCVFWDYTVNVWSAEGCRVEWTNSTHTGCQCSHLTNFALLMDVHAVPLSPSHALALHLITVIGCAISAVALFAALIVFHCFKGMKTDRITIHKNLCACLLIAELIFMVGVDRTANRVLCGVIAAFLHYFFLAAFAWMFLEGFQLYAMLVEVFEPERARARWYYPAAYVTPLVIVGVSAIIDPTSYGTSQHCWLRADNYFILSFLVPVAVVLVANWLCLFMVIYMMCRHSNVSIKAKENNKLHKIKVWLRSSVFLAVLLGLTWTFGLLYLNEQTIFMAYAFSILNSLQGLFIFIFHCLQNETFQKECGRLGRQHSWLSCCLRLAPATSPPVAGATGSSSAPQVQQAPAQHTLPSSASKHSARHHHRQQQHQNDDQCLEDVSDMDHNAPTQRYTLKQHHHQPQESPRSWNTSSRPSAPPYVPPPADQSASHSLSMPSIHNNGYPQPPAQHYHQPNRAGTPVPAEFQSDYNNGIMNNDPNDPRSRSPSCFSVKMGGQSEQGGWGVVQNPLSSAGVTGTWKSTSSKHQGAVSSNSLQHPDHARRIDAACRPIPQQIGSRHDTAPRHSARQHHYHPHSYSEISRHRRGSEDQYRDIHDDPVYEEIERNVDNTLMSDMSDDNSGHGAEGCIRQADLVGSIGHHHGNQSSKFYGDHRPLISYSPGERHRYDRSPVALDHHAPHGKYSSGRWDGNVDRHANVNMEQGRPVYGYRPKERALAAVLNGDNDVASRVLCHGEHPRNVLQAYSDDI